MSRTVYAEPPGNDPGMGTGTGTGIGTLEHAHGGITFTAWTDELAAEQNGNSATAANSLPKSAGNYYLTEAVILSDTWKVDSGTVINLCLNGKRITCSLQYKYLIEVDGATLNLFDEEENAGVIQFTTENPYRYCVRISNSGTFNMYGGKISDNPYTAVQVYNSSTFNMYGGEISGNTATMSGAVGGIYVSGSMKLFGKGNDRYQYAEKHDGGVLE